MSSSFYIFFASFMVISSVAFGTKSAIEDDMRLALVDFIIGAGWLTCLIGRMNES